MTTNQNVDDVVSKVKGAQSDKKGHGTWKVLDKVLSKFQRLKVRQTRRITIKQEWQLIIKPHYTAD